MLAAHLEDAAIFVVDDIDAASVPAGRQLFA
jgi:hypothetical protein